MNKQEHLPQSEVPAEATEFQPGDEIWTRKAGERLAPYDAVPHTPLTEVKSTAPERPTLQKEAGIITMCVMHMRRNEQIKQNSAPRTTTYNEYELTP